MKMPGIEMGALDHLGVEHLANENPKVTVKTPNRQKMKLPRVMSPLRYPGGKSSFINYVAEAVKLQPTRPKVFVEPFCGGASIALAMLERDLVDQVGLNDQDPLVASFWKTVLGETAVGRRDFNWLIRRVETFPVTIESFKQVRDSKPVTYRELAFKCLFLNRTCFNGILSGAGPIGGWGQVNRTLDVRFNRETLVKRLELIWSLRERFVGTGEIGYQAYCNQFKRHKDVFYYLDPPYWAKAEGLYEHHFQAQGHTALRNYLSGLKQPWLLSYDDAPEVRALYADMPSVDGHVIDSAYSSHPIGGASFIGRELMYSNCALPQQHIQSSRTGATWKVCGSIADIVPAVKQARRSTTTTKTEKR